MEEDVVLDGEQFRRVLLEIFIPEIRRPDVGESLRAHHRKEFFSGLDLGIIDDRLSRRVSPRVIVIQVICPRFRSREHARVSEIVVHPVHGFRYGKVPLEVRLTGFKPECDANGFSVVCEREREVEHDCKQEERHEKQKLIINVTMDADLAAAGKSDDLADSVDYKAVKKRILEVVEGSECRLIESVAHRIADTCLEDPGVSRVRVRVDKPGALRFARSVAVEIERSREG